MSSKGKLDLEFRQEKIIENDEYRMFETFDFSDFEGKLLTLIESWGLPEIQEQAIKGLIRKEIWNFWYTGIEPIGRKGQITSNNTNQLPRN